MALFTVLMPAYNAQRYLAQAIESVLLQDLRDFELLVLNDGSTDDTAKIAGRYARVDKRVHLLNRARQGQVASRNELLASSKTEIIAWADADDISLPHRFSLQYAALSQRPDLAALGTMMIVVDHDGRRVGMQRNPVGAERVVAELERRVALAQTSSMMRRQIAIDAGGFREAYAAAEDYDLLLRLGQLGSLDNLNVVGVHYRRNAAGVSALDTARQLFSADMARATHRLRLSGAYDPTEGMTRPPSLNDDVLDMLMPEDIAFHRAIDGIRSSDTLVVEAALSKLLGMSLPRRRTRLVQKVLLEYVIAKPSSVLALKALIRGIQLGPIRFARLLAQRR